MTKKPGLTTMNNLQKLPPAIDLETKTILKKTNTANRKLAELKGILNTIPNAAILINTLYIQEAKDSSAIENIITTHDEIYKQNLFADLITNPAVKEVENYAHALQIGLKLIKENGILSLNMIRTIQQTIVQNNAGFRKQQGTQLINEQTGEIIYTPFSNLWTNISSHDLVLASTKLVLSGKPETEPSCPQALISEELPVF